MAHTYSSLCGLAYYRAAILHRVRAVETRYVVVCFHVFNQGHHLLDFTNVEIIEGIVRTLHCVAGPNEGWSSERPDPATSSVPYRLYNIGHHSPVQLMTFIGCLEQELGRTAAKNFLPLQPGDVPATYADVSDLRADLGFEPNHSPKNGCEALRRLVRSYYGN